MSDWSRMMNPASASSLGAYGGEMLRSTDSGLWPYIQALERACWSRKWSEVKAARKAIEQRIGKRPHDPAFPPKVEDE